MPKRVQTTWIMCHSEYCAKNKEHGKEVVFADYKVKKVSAVETEFHEIAKLSEDGFIFPDNSLRFKFKVKRQDPLKAACAPEP